MPCPPRAAGHPMRPATPSSAAGSRGSSRSEPRGPAPPAPRASPRPGRRAAQTRGRARSSRAPARARCTWRLRPSRRRARRLRRRGGSGGDGAARRGGCSARPAGASPPRPGGRHPPRRAPAAARLGIAPQPAPAPITRRSGFAATTISRPRVVVAAHAGHGREDPDELAPVAAPRILRHPPPVPHCAHRRHTRRDHPPPALPLPVCRRGAGAGPGLGERRRVDRATPPPPRRHSASPLVHRASPPP